MLIICAICSDLFEEADEVYGTSCGHLFHYLCLMQWIERSPSCPQCRTKTKRRQIHRIYFNTEGPSTWQDRIDSLTSQLRMKDTDIKNVNENNELLNQQNEGLREEIKKLEGKVREEASNVAVLREQNQCLRHQCMEAEKAFSECENLRKHVELQREEIKKLEGKVREVASNMAVLREQNQCLRKQAMEAEKAVSECENLRKRVELQREEITELEGIVIEDASNMAVLREQKECLRKQAMEAEKAVSECENLRKHVELQREKTKKLEGKVREEASRMAVLREQNQCLRKQTIDAECAVYECENLRKHVVFLQREMKSMTEEKGNILNGVIELGMLAMFFLEYQTSQSKLDFQINAKRQLEKDLEHLEHERKRPLKKIKLLEEAMISPSTSHPAESAPRRLIAESPAPVDIQRPKLSDPEDDMLTHSLVTMADEKECDDQLMTNLTSNHWTNHLSPDSPSLEGIEKLERKLREASSNTAVLREQTQCLLKQTKEAEKAVNKCTRVEKYFEFLQRSRGPERSGSFT